MQITVEFGGGAELLFDNKKVHDVLLPHKDKKWTLGDLLFWLKENLLTERPELFLQDGSVFLQPKKAVLKFVIPIPYTTTPLNMKIADTTRPGILVLVNDADWELMDTVNYAIEPNDKIIFISTLHGG